MKSHEALRLLAEVSASQWGMVTTAQARERGISRLTMSRLADAGALERHAYGVYRDSGAPADEYAELRAAWLSTEPSRLAEERLRVEQASVTVTGASAAWLHGIGDLRPLYHEFSSPVRRQSQRAEVRHRQRDLLAKDVTIAQGLPVTAVERTIADLVESRTDLTLVADALRDASRLGRVDFERLAEHLAPLAARNGHRRGDGEALLERLRVLAGLDVASLAREILAIPDLRNQMVAQWFRMIDVEAFRKAVMPSVGLKVAFPGVDSLASAFQDAMPKVEIATIPQLNPHLRTLLSGARSLSAAEPLKRGGPDG
jgi:predicted transcriptional regulator of viral defense system